MWQHAIRHKKNLSKNSPQQQYAVDVNLAKLAAKTITRAASEGQRDKTIFPFLTTRPLWLGPIRRPDKSYAEMEVAG